MKTLKIYLLPALFLALLCVGTVATAATLPEDVVRSTADAVLSRIKVDRENLKANPSAVRGLADELIMPYFDFEKMAQWVLGKHWRETDPTARKRFVEEFRTLLVRTYARALIEYSDEQISYFPTNVEAGAEEVEVRTMVERANAGSAGAIAINYRMYQKDGAWKVFDVSVDGVAMVSTYRNSFASEINKKGINGLIDALAEKNRRAVTAAAAETTTQ